MSRAQDGRSGSAELKSGKGVYCYCQKRHCARTQEDTGGLDLISADGGNCVDVVNGIVDEVRSTICVESLGQTNLYVWLRNWSSIGDLRNLDCSVRDAMVW